MKKNIKIILLCLLLCVMILPGTVKAYDYDFSKGFYNHKIDEICGNIKAVKTEFYAGDHVEKGDFIFEGYVVIEGKKYDESSIEIANDITILPLEHYDIDGGVPITFYVYDEEGTPISYFGKSVKELNINISLKPLYYLDKGKEIIISKYNFYSDKLDSDGYKRTWSSVLLDNKIVTLNNEKINGYSQLRVDGKPIINPSYGFNKIDFKFEPSTEDNDYYVKELTGIINVFRLPESKYVKSTSTTIYYSDTKNDTNKVLQYKLDNGKWTSKSKFTGLKPNTKHTLSIRVKKTKDHAASKVIKVTIQTKKK